MSPDQRFGRWTLVEQVYRQKGHGYWLCRCDCGASAIVRDEHFRSGRSKSCGCLRRELGTEAIANTAQANLIHGLARRGQVAPEYRSWHAMLQRCEDPKHPAFRNYGGRGITVCPRWHVLEHFVADLGLRPFGTSLDRIDNDRGYEPGNCRWATAKEQRENQRPKRRSA